MLDDRSTAPPAHPRRSRPAAAAVAFGALAGALLVRALLDPFMHDTLPLVTLFGAVAAAVWFGGAGTAIAVAALGYLACNYFFIPPRGAFTVLDAQTTVGLLAYLFTCALIIAIGEALHRAQRRAVANQELLQVTLASIGDAVITTDVAGRVTYLNPVAETLTGWTAAAALDQPLEAVFRIIDEQSREAIESPALRALREGAIVGFQNHTLLIDRQGEELAVDDSAAPIRDEGGRVSGCVLIFRDVARRRRGELEEADRLLAARTLAAIVETSDDAIISKSLDGTIRSWNAAAERLFGWPAAAAVGRHISLVIPPDRISEEEEIVATLKAGRRVDHFETERVRRDGQLIRVSLTISPLKDEHGTIVGASKIVRDVTEARRTHAEREMFVTLVENSTDFIGICDLEGVPFFINAAGLRLVGLDSLEQAKRTNVRDFFFPEDQALIAETFLPAVVEAGHGEIEIRFRHFTTGAARWMAYKVIGIKDDGGRLVAFATVSQDITERRRLEDDLRKLADDLSEVDRRKDEFLATLSHELRNPLAPMRTMLDVLRRQGVDEDTRANAFDIVERQLAQLVRLVDDLLDLSRITHNRIELRLGRVELASILHQAVRASEALAAAAGVTLASSLANEPLYVRGDAVRLAQIFGNLLSNACKYTAAGGTVRVTARVENGAALVAVEDSGAGIPPDKLESIFEMFTQLDRSLERSQGGLGIGLTLVKRLVEMHGGSVEARSAGESQGSTFLVRLPLAAPGSDDARAPVATERSPTARTILVVDDNRDAAESLALLLELHGHRTVQAADGAEALAAAERERPDIVLLDLGLPVLSGYQNCRRNRAEPWGAATTRVALTGRGQEEDRRKSRDAGFDGHLVKPVDFTELMALLARSDAARGTT